MTRHIPGVLIALLAILVIVSCGQSSVPPPTVAPVLLATSAPATVPAPTAAPTQVPPTAVPPTAVPPSAVPPTAVPPTAVPPTAAPATAAAPTVAPTTVPPTTVPTAVPPTAAPTVEPTQVPPTAAPTTSDSTDTGPRKFGQAELDKLFPPGRGQDLVFQACNNCHNWVPIAITQPTAEMWGNIMKDHRNRVSALTDQDYEFLSEYLVANFGPDHPVPEYIPEDLLQQWTSY